MPKKVTTEEFIARAQEVFGDRWDYSKTVYIGALTPITITCRQHGDFQQYVHSHYRGHVGCAQCRGGLTQETFLQKAIEVWGDRWDYSKVEYKAQLSPVTIICKEHGEFEHTPQQHLLFHVGCPACNRWKMSPEQFIQEASQVWEGKWDYSQTEFSTARALVTVICPEHGAFEQEAHSHLKGFMGCRGCFPFGSSIQEIELFEFVRSLVPDAVQGARILGRKEIDIHVPSKQVGFEFNGVFWHSEKFKEKTYHKDKFDLAASNGIRLVQIWEDDWALRPEIVKEHIRQVLGLSVLPKIAARKTEVREVPYAEARGFLQTYHIQGPVPASVFVGLYFENELVALAGFKRGGEDYTLVRYASNANVQGGHSKVVSYFEKHYSYEKLVTFADLTFSDGGLYRSTGWTEDKILAPDYMYARRGSSLREHKFGYRLKRFREDPALQYIEGLSESRLAALNGLNRVWDAGKIRFVKLHPDLTSS